MTITVQLAPAVLERLHAEVAASGTGLDDFVREAIEAKLDRRRSLAEALSPIHSAVEASGLNEDEVNALLERELQAHRLEQRQKIA